MKAFLFLMALLLLAVPAAAQTADDAHASLVQAERCIRNMEGYGLSTTRANDLLKEAWQVQERAGLADRLEQGLLGPAKELTEKSLAGLSDADKTYSGVLARAGEICALKDDALYFVDSSQVFEGSLGAPEPLSTQGSGLGTLIAGQFFSPDTTKQLVDTSEAEQLLAQAKQAFAEERYEKAESLLLEAQANLEEKKAEITTLTLISAAGTGFFEKYWPEFTIFLILLSLASWLAWRIYRRRRLRKKIRRLKLEKKSLRELMRKAQEDRFRRGTLSDSLYTIKMNKYKERLARIKETLPALEASLKGRPRKEKAKKPEKPAEQKEKRLKRSR